MKKFFRTLLIIGGGALAAKLGFSAYRKISGVVKLSKSLPEFLSNVYGESPKASVNRSLNMISIRLGFSQDTLDKHEDIENTVREYIDDFYPEVARCSVDIELYVKGEDEGEEYTLEDAIEEEENQEEEEAEEKPEE